MSGETPAKKNSRITLRNGRTIPSKRFRDWHKVAMLEMNIQKNAQGLTKPIEKPVSIDVVFCHGDKRRRDSDNSYTSIQDLLVDCKVLKDDCWLIVKKHSVSNGYIKNNASVCFTVTELE